MSHYLWPDSVDVILLVFRLTSASHYYYYHTPLATFLGTWRTRFRTCPCPGLHSRVLSLFSLPHPQLPSAQNCVLTRAARIFERGASFVGLDFLAHPFWDKYIEYEERQEAHDRIYTIHARLLAIPLHQYARYFERFRSLTESRSVAELIEPAAFSHLRSEFETAMASGQVPALEVERDIRSKVDAAYYELSSNTSAEVTKRWTFEQGIKRPYFHVTELDYPQLHNWREYLDFEESEGDVARITALYERCLVTCALYEEFWLRYARWMSGQEAKDEDVRIIFMKAATLFVPVSRPGIRLQWAYFEESIGRIDAAEAIHEAILTQIPDCTEVLISWANLARRQHGIEEAIRVYTNRIEAPTVDLYTKAALVAEWAYLLWKTKRSADEARAVFLKNAQWYADSRMFWERWFQFEIEQPVTDGDHGKRVQHVFDELCSKSRLSIAAKRELGQIYLGYLVELGDKTSMKTFLKVDRELFG